MVGIFAGVYGNIAKYREGMLMGVHIPKSELEHPDVKELLQLYKKRNRQFYLWNMPAGIAVCLLCFTYFSIFITVWTLWFVEFCLLTILRVYHYHQKVYDIKQKNGWISSANADVSAAVDTRTSSQIAKKILPAKLHLIPAADVYKRQSSDCITLTWSAIRDTLFRLSSLYGSYPYLKRSFTKSYRKF